MVAVCIAAGVVDNVEAVDINYDNPVIEVLVRSGAFKYLIAHHHKLVSVVDLGDLVNVRHSLDNKILFLFGGNIHNSAAHAYAACFGGLIAEIIPMIVPVCGHCPEINGMYLVLGKTLGSVFHSRSKGIEDYPVLGVESFSDGFAVNIACCGNYSQHFADLVGNVEKVAFLLLKQKTDLRGIHCKLILFLGLAELLGGSNDLLPELVHLSYIRTYGHHNACAAVC